MPGKYSDLLAPFVVALTAISGMFIAIYKNLGLAKEVREQTADTKQFKKDIEVTVSAQKAEITDLRDFITAGLDDRDAKNDRKFPSIEHTDAMFKEVKNDQQNWKSHVDQRMRQFELSSQTKHVEVIDSIKEINQAIKSMNDDEMNRLRAENDRYRSKEK